MNSELIKRSRRRNWLRAVHRTSKVEVGIALQESRRHSNVAADENLTQQRWTLDDQITDDSIPTSERQISAVSKPIEERNGALFGIFRI